MTMQKIAPVLWFDGRAQEAIDFYQSVFKSFKLGEVFRYPPGMPNAGDIATVTFWLEGQQITILNGGPHFKLTEAVSIQIMTDHQEETDYYWNALIAGGGEESMCGWVKDKFGLSWQVTPKRLMELVTDADRAKASRVMQAMMQMRKIDIRLLEEAAAG